MCECVVDIIMWKFAFLVHLLIGIIAVVFCTLFLLPRFSDFFLVFWLCQSDLRIYNVKISSENTITTTVISIHCWKLHHWHCEISNQDLFVSVFSILSLSPLPCFLCYASANANSVVQLGQQCIHENQYICATNCERTEQGEFYETECANVNIYKKR